MELIFMESVPLDTVWGGTKLKEYFGYEHYSNYVGQTWGFACQGKYVNRVIDGQYKGRTLLDLWENETQLFKSKEKQFPFIVALLGPEENLSVQVHPTSDYAKTQGFPNGKNEAWFFIEPPEKGRIVYGHDLISETDVKKAMNENNILKHLSYLPIEKNDFVYIPAGQIHACAAGSVVYEISQSVNVTYRVYDYHRKDTTGSERPLNIKEAGETIVAPAFPPQKVRPRIYAEQDQYTIYTYDFKRDFIVDHIDLHGIYRFVNPQYRLATVLRGTGTANGRRIKTGDHFLIPAGNTNEICGSLDLMIAMERGNIVE